MREFCRQSQAEVVSNSRNKIHQTWGRLSAKPCIYPLRLLCPEIILVCGLEKFVPAVAYHSCLNLPETFSQPRTSIISGPSMFNCRLEGSLPLSLVLIMQRKSISVARDAAAGPGERAPFPRSRRAWPARNPQSRAAVQSVQVESAVARFEGV